MAYTLLHVNEFTYLIHSGSITLTSERLFNEAQDTAGVEIFRSVGYLKYSSPEAYMLCRVNEELLRLRPKNSGGTEVLLSIVAVYEFIPLTQQAELLLRPIIDRVHLRVSSPRFQDDWQAFVDKEILRERREAALEFTKLFSCEELIKADWQPISGLQEFIIKDLGNAFNQIERLKESSELGVFEFCVRLAKEHDEAWLKNPVYENLKTARREELSGKKLASFSFLESKKICTALREFEEEAVSLFGYSPFCLVPFFEFYRSHSKATGINYGAIRTTALKLLRSRRYDDAVNFVHLVGYSLGLEEVIPARYFISKECPSIFDTSKSTFPTKESIAIEMPLEIDDLFASSTDSGDFDVAPIQGEVDPGNPVAPLKSEQTSNRESKGLDGESSVSTETTGATPSANEETQEANSLGTEDLDSDGDRSLATASNSERQEDTERTFPDNETNSHDASASAPSEVNDSAPSTSKQNQGSLGLDAQQEDTDKKKSEQLGVGRRNKKKST